MGGILQGIINPATAFPPAATTDRLVAIGSGTGQTGNRVFLANANAGQFTQQNDLIVIGNNALSAGTIGTPLSDVNMAGMVIVGSGAAQALTATTAFATRGPSTIIGFKALNASPLATSNTIIGSNAAGTYVNEPFPSQFINGNVILGESALNNITHANFGIGQGITQNVIVGVGACAPAASQTLSFIDNVIIGFQTCDLGISTGPVGGGTQRSVVIGSQAGAHFQSVSAANFSSSNVYIGYTADDQGSPSANVVIGTGANCALASVNSPTNNVVIGSSGGGSTVGGTADNVVLGSEVQNNPANSRCILIGRALGRATGNAIPVRNDQFLIETVQTPPGGTRRVMFYGVMCDGATNGTGIVFGFSTEGTNRDIQGQNTFKIINGSVGVGAPLGGGYLYGNAGRLHWVDTNNVDWALVGTATGQLGGSTFALTNNAGAQAATITNGPLAGNPTKWVPYNDNGTIRNIPMW